MNGNVLSVDSVENPSCTMTRNFLIVECNNAFSDAFVQENHAVLNKPLGVVLPSLATLFSTSHSASDNIGVPPSQQYFTWQEYKPILNPVFKLLNSYICNALDLKLEPTSLNTNGAAVLKLTFIPINTNQSYVEKLKSERDKAYKQLFQSEKLALIGQLSTGIAHEINNPVGFISSNIQTLSDYLETIEQGFESLRRLVTDLGNEELNKQLAQELESSQFQLILSDAKETMKESLDGAERLTDIIKKLKRVYSYRRR